MLVVRVLGGLSAELDGRAVELPADARARELLGRLVVAPGPHARSSLAGSLRPDAPEESARKTLRDAVYELRRALGPAGRDALEAGREQVGLREDAVHADLWAFRRLRAAGDLEAAVEQCQGELLAGFDSDWVLRARDEHAAELAETLAELARRARDAGDLAAATRWVRRRLEVEPLAEDAHQDLVRLLALAGDRPAALATAAALTERLRRELGVPPSAQTRALVEEVRRGRVRGAGSDGEPLASPRLAAVLARGTRAEGRDAALAQLAAAWADATAGGLRTALVTGEPGIGKTTLAGELARRLHAQGAAVLYGRSDEQALVPYQPWVEALEPLLEALPAGSAADWLAAHDGALARLLPARSASTPAPAQPRERYVAFETVRALLERTAEGRPLLLVLDDLHWADQDSLALLRHVARGAQHARMLLVLCARDAELPPPVAHALGDLRREAPLLHVALSGLDENAIAAVLVGRTGRADAGAAQRYLRRTGGNPLFLDELLRDAPGHEEDGEPPPPGIRDVVARRLAGLAPRVRAVLELAAVVGLEFEVDALTAAGGQEPLEVLEALDEAIAAGLVTPAHPGGRHAFAHALVAEAIVAGLPVARAARLHLQVAEHLARSGGAAAATHVGEVVRHLRGAGPLVAAPRLVEWELAAAREAGAALAYEEAAAHYEAALAIRSAALEPERGERLLALGDARERAGRRAPAQAAFREAAALARARHEPRLLAQAALGFGGLAVVIAAPEAQTRSLLEEALAALPRGEWATAARLRARLAVELYYAEPDRAGELSRAAVSDARASGDAGALAAALNARRVALWDPGHVEERLAIVEEMLAAAEAAGDREAALQARNWRVVDLWELGRVRELRAEIDAYEALAEQLGLPHYRWYVPLWRAGLAILAGEWARGAALGEQALALGKQAEDANAPLLVRIQRGFALEVQRRWADIDRTWVGEAAGNAPDPAPWRAWLAEIDALTGDHDAARVTVVELASDDFAALPMRVNWLAACELADAAAEIGDRHAAAGLYARLAPHAASFAVVARGVGCCNATEYYLGRLAAALGNVAEAETRLRRAAAAAEHAGFAPYAAASLARLGGVLAARGAHAQARDTLAEARARAERLAMPALLAEVQAALAAAGSSSPGLPLRP